MSNSDMERLQRHMDIAKTASGEKPSLKYHPKVKKDLDFRYPKGVSFPSSVDSLLHTNMDSLSKWVDTVLPEYDWIEKKEFMNQVMDDPNWEYEDLEFAWVREGDKWLTMAKNNPNLLRNEGFAKIVDFYEGDYPGDDIYRAHVLKGKKKRLGIKDVKPYSIEDKVMDDFIEADNKYNMGE